MTQAWFDAMVRASLQGAILAAAVWLLLAAWKQPSPSVRAGLWLLAALKFVLGLLFVVEMAVLPATPVVPLEFGEAGVEAAGVPAAVFEWKAVLAGAWAAGVLVVALWALAGTRRLRRLIRESSLAPMPVRDAWVSVGGPVRTEVRVHPQAEMPMVIGLVRPVVVLPSALLDRLDEEELRMVLAHENAHLKRGDAAASIPMFACFALFYFHPVVWLVQREWQRNREAACDTSAMAAVGADPRRYGQMLLKVSVSAKSTTVLALSAAPSFRTLHRRIKDMKQPSKKMRGGAAWTAFLVLAAAAAAIPFTLVERQVSVNSDGQESAAGKAAVAPSTTVRAAGQGGAVNQVTPTPGATAGAISQAAPSGKVSAGAVRTVAPSQMPKSAAGAVNSTSPAPGVSAGAVNTVVPAQGSAASAGTVIRPAPAPRVSAGAVNRVAPMPGVSAGAVNRATPAPGVSAGAVNVIAPAVAGQVKAKPAKNKVRPAKAGKVKTARPAKIRPAKAAKVKPARTATRKAPKAKIKPPKQGAAAPVRGGTTTPQGGAVSTGPVTASGSAVAAGPLTSSGGSAGPATTSQGGTVSAGPRAGAVSSGGTVSTGPRTGGVTGGSATAGPKTGGTASAGPATGGSATGGAKTGMIPPR